MDRSAAVEVIKKSSLSKHANVLADFLEPGFLITAKPIAMSKLKVGASRFGGMPDVPPKFAWPIWTMKKTITERPNPFKPGAMMKVGSPGGKRAMHFLAQIRIDDLPQGPGRELLPSTGTLYFFYDSKETHPGPRVGIGWKVIHDTTPVEKLTRLKSSPVPKGEAGFKSCVPTFKSGVSGRSQDIPIKGWNYEMEEPWTALLDQIEGESKRKHRLLGGTRTVQYDVRRACVRGDKGVTFEDEVPSKKEKEMEKEEADWLLLLQLDYDESVDWSWFSGRVFFMIRRQDLIAGRFDRVWVELQYD